MDVEAYSLTIQQEREDRRLDQEEDELVQDPWNNEPDPDAQYDAMRDREIWDA